MAQLYPILVVAIVLLVDRGVVPPASANAAGGPLGAVLVALVPPFLYLAGAAITMRVCAGRLRAGGTTRPIEFADRVVHLGRWFLLANHAFAVLVAGWVTTVRGTIGDLILIDELVAILPPIVGAVALWWLHYPIERRVREALLLSRLDRGRPVYQIPQRGRFVMQQVRLNLLLLLVPVLAILALAEMIQAVDLAGSRGWPAWATEVATLGAGIGVFFVAPILARLVLSVERLGAGVVREDLLEVCRRHRVRVRAFLLWKTDGTMVNAAVMGLAGPLRYVLLTDALVESMSRDEVRAVMAHEIGHVKRHHMPWLVLSLLAMLVLASFVVSVPLVLLDVFGVAWDARGAGWIDGSATVAAAVLALLGFGWISRRYERQADTFAVQHLSGLGHAPAPVVSDEAVSAMRSALGAVARLNTVDPHRRSWRHGSIAWRQAYLSSLVGRPVDALVIDRLVRRLKVAVALTLAAGLLISWITAGWSG